MRNLLGETEEGVVLNISCPQRAIPFTLQTGASTNRKSQVMRTNAVCRKFIRPAGKTGVDLRIQNTERCHNCPSY